MSHPMSRRTAEDDLPITEDDIYLMRGGPSAAKTAASPPRTSTDKATTFPTSVLESLSHDDGSGKPNMRKARLETTPNEILHLICRRLPMSSRVQLALTSKTIASHLTKLPAILSTNKEQLQQDNYEAVMLDPTIGSFRLTGWVLCSYEDTGYISCIEEENFSVECKICKSENKADPLDRYEHVFDTKTNRRSTRRLYKHTRRHFNRTSKDSVFTNGMFELTLWKLKEEIRLFNVDLVKRTMVRWLLMLPELPIQKLY